MIPFLPVPEFSTERLILKQISENDMDEYYVLKSDERLLKNYDAKPKTYQEAKAFLKKIDEGIAKNEWIVWGIYSKETKKLMGSICYWNIAAEELKAEIGYELLYEYHGKGIMHEAIVPVIQYGFDIMGLESIVADPNPGNIPSVRLLEKNGFLRGPVFSATSPEGQELPRVWYTLKRA